ncbi:MAG: prolipoprotein diacylglyceryl transferase [Clostridia bacterium]|nr:prolipoprotein diacylglyceryl transferase [Clostridia bacterium]
MEFEDTILFSAFGLPVTAYALCLALSLAAGLALFFLLGKKRGIGQDALWLTALLALPLGLLGARLFYCVARVYYFLEIGLENIPRLWDGGYALWGAAGGVALSAMIAAKREKQPLGKLLDTLAPPAALVIALTRFAEYFSGEGRGLYMDQEAFCFFPVSVYRADYDEWHLAVFVWEGLAALIIFAALLRGQRKTGNTARLFLLLYSACQIWMESMRRDSTLRWLFVRVSQLTAGLVIVGLMTAAAIRWARKAEIRRMKPSGIILCWAAVLAGVGICVAMEFSVEGKIFVDLPVWAAYAIMAVCCVGIGAAAYQTVFRGLKTE